MKIPLICHWNGESDIAAAFVKYYHPWVSKYHIILHGPPEDSSEILALSKEFPILIRDQYRSDFDDGEKKNRINALLPEFVNSWVLVVDSDEFVELPYGSLSETIAHLERSGVTSLAAPMLQRLRGDGSLDSPDILLDPFSEFPLCSEGLYALMGGDGNIGKYPLFFVSSPHIAIGIGNHVIQKGATESSAKGVTHHFKWKKSAIGRINKTIEIGWPWAPTESVPYLRYLQMHDLKLPLTDAFVYSREELFRRNLLRTVVVAPAKEPLITGNGGFTGPGLYAIRSKHSGKMMDIDLRGSRGQDNGQPLHQWEFNGGSNQQFEIVDASAGTYAILPRHTRGKALDIIDMSTADGAGVQQWQWHVSDNQRFRVEPIDGFYRIVALHSGKVLDVPAFCLENGARIQQWSWNGGDNQLFEFSRIP